MFTIYAIELLPKTGGWYVVRGVPTSGSRFSWGTTGPVERVPPHHSSRVRLWRLILCKSRGGEENLNEGGVGEGFGVIGDDDEAVGAGVGGEVTGALPGDEADGRRGGKIAGSGEKAGQAGRSAPVSCELSEGEAG